MIKDLKRLGKETFIYGFSTVGGRLLNFLLLPIYTHTLAPSDYGVVATVFSYLAFLNVIYGYGMDFAFMRHAKPRDPGDSCFSTAFGSHFVTSIFLSAFIYLFASKLCVLAAIPSGLAIVPRAAAVILAFDALCLVPFADLRLSHNAKTYAGIKVFNIALNLGLTYYFLARAGMGISGVFLAGAITSAATFLLLAPKLLSRLRWTFNPILLSDLLKFSLPLVPAGLASMAIQVIDRPILKFLTNDATVGLYQANYRLGAVMMLGVAMFDAAWRPFFLEKAEDAAGTALFARVMTYFLAIAAFIWLALTFFIGPLACRPLFDGKSLIDPAYWAGLSIVPVVGLGYVLNGVYINLLAPVTLAKKTNRVAFATALGAAVNIAALFAWTPRWGMMGAAAATAAAYAAMSAGLYVMARRIYPIDYELGRAARIAAAAGGIIIAAKALGVGMLSGSLGIKIALLAAFPLCLAGTGFLDARERAWIKSRLR
ncbi:MAG: lipopolysaccharide biosynthesis protein [Elusimicrobiota bacterium]